jgi:tripartite-type tricarboxylate transporter receptor subunit TctC
LKARFAEIGAEPMMMTPAEFESFVVDETEKWAKVIRADRCRMTTSMPTSDVRKK